MCVIIEIRLIAGLTADFISRDVIAKSYINIDKRTVYRQIVDAPVSREQMIPVALFKKFYKFIHKNRKNSINISNNAIVCNCKDGCLWIFIYCYNTL